MVLGLPYGLLGVAMDLSCMKKKICLIDEKTWNKGDISFDFNVYEITYFCHPRRALEAHFHQRK